VRILPAMPHEELATLYAACDVYAWPDRSDRPRLAVMEAQAHGRPAVTMDLPAARLTVADGRTGLLARDLVDFADKLAALLGDPERCALMGAEARRYIERRHSIAVRAGQLEELLRP
jgi:phosphatidyl-myo-inositol dimannoside synthase